jgi:hypothetical protein
MVLKKIKTIPITTIALKKSSVLHWFFHKSHWLFKAFEITKTSRALIVIVNFNCFKFG